jgi:hypothetical protein
MRAWLFVALWAGAAAAAPLPADPRLATERARLQAIVDGAEHDGLPAELLAAKVREGLAKNVPPARIAQAVGVLAGALRQARGEAAPIVQQPSAALLQAIVEAHALGATRADVESLLRVSGAKGAPLATRAVEVLGDLLQRGFPTSPSARVVTEVAGHRASVLDQLVVRAETLAQLAGVSRSDALEALQRASALGLGLDQASQLLHGRDASSDAPSNGKGPPRETAGDRGPHSPSDHGSKGKGD